jgi:ParB family chromosome partitioning protein
VAKKSGLGKGLESLMGESAAEVGHSEDTSLPIDQIVPNPNQPRVNFDEEALMELADSIKQNGVLQPILVRKVGKQYQIVAGERRYQASKRAGLKEIPVVVRDIDDNKVFQLALIENLQRSDLNSIEEARGYKQLLKDQKLTQEELANILSKSRSAIANTIRLLDLPEEVQDLIVQGLLTSGHARAILAVPTKEGRIKLANKVVLENLSVRQTETLAPLFSVDTPAAKPRVASPQSFKRAAKQLRRVLDTNVRVKQVRGKNKIEIEFKDDDDLARILTHINGDEVEVEDY